MFDSIKRITKKEQGFTLIELLAVIAIIGVLIALAAPNVFETVERADEETLKADARTLANASHAYVAVTDGEDYEADVPGSIEDMTTTDGVLEPFVDIDGGNASELDDEVFENGASSDDWQSFTEELNDFARGND